MKVQIQTETHNDSFRFCDTLEEQPLKPFSITDLETIDHVLLIG